MVAERIAPSTVVVRRHNGLFDLYNNYPGGGDPDDDPGFVAEARRIMGLPPLAEDNETSRSDARRDDDSLRLRGITTTVGPSVAEELRAAGHDVTPGHDQLHHYWTRGEGLAKWLGHPHEWTTLYHHLLKYAPNPEAAKRWASAWFHEVKGFWPGADLHRVEHGKPPRGKRVGPG